MAQSISSLYDASTSAKIMPSDLIPPPLDIDAVKMGYVSDTVGFGLFAARDIKSDEYFLHENPMMRAHFDEHHSRGAATTEAMLSAWREAVRVNRTGFSFAYPRFARRAGIDPATWADATAVQFECLGSNLIHGRFAGALGPPADSSLDETKYQRWAQGGLRLSTSRSSEAKAVLDFFRGYAFMADQSARRADSTACAYLLCSLVNHRCMPEEEPFDARKGPNATFLIGGNAGVNRGLARFLDLSPGSIAIQARRDISEGEEISIHYGKRGLKFSCHCVECRTKKKKGFFESWGIL